MPDVLEFKVQDGMPKPPPDVLTVDLSTSDDVLKVVRAVRTPEREIRLGRKDPAPPVADVQEVSDTIRETLTKLNEYVRTYPGPPFKPEDATGYPKYHRLLTELRSAGCDLHTLLVGDLARFSEAKDYELKVTFGTESDTLPIGFAHDGRPLPSDMTAPPSVDHFAGFWVRKFPKTSLFLTEYMFEGEALWLAESFRTLYATDSAEWEKALEASASDQQFIERVRAVWALDVGRKSNWSAAKDAWPSIATVDNILLFFGHSDGTKVEIAADRKPSSILRDWFQRKKEGPGSTLLIANACCSLRPKELGRKGTSLLSLGALPRFVGMVGTEAEILNATALKCVTRLIEDLCFNECPLGIAFDLMRADEELFPLNLFYSCYGDRSFRLDKPVARPAKEVLNGSAG